MTDRVWVPRVWPDAMLRAFYEKRCSPEDTPAGGFTRWAAWDDIKDSEGPRIADCWEAALSAAAPSGDGEAVRPITMQDVRLAVGEGYLTPADVLAGCNAELFRRSRVAHPPGGLSVEEVADLTIALDAIRRQTDYWREWDAAQRLKEGLQVEPGTHIVSPPSWPTHGQLIQWSVTLSKAQAILAAMEPRP